MFICKNNNNSGQNYVMALLFDYMLLKIQNSCVSLSHSVVTHIRANEPCNGLASSYVKQKGSKLNL